MRTMIVALQAGFDWPLNVEEAPQAARAPHGAIRHAAGGVTTPRALIQRATRKPVRQATVGGAQIVRDVLVAAEPERPEEGLADEHR
jgi:hypothetical protein